MRGFLIALAALASASAADAAQYAVTAGHDGITDISAVITTSDTLNAVGGYDILGIEGSSTWGDIVGLITNPGQPGTSYYFPDGHVTATPDFGYEWTFDNVLYADGGPWFSENGVLFETASVVWNLAIYQGRDYLGISTRGQWNAVEYQIPITVTPIAAVAAPEPAAWAMMVAGFGLIGGALRRRRASGMFGKRRFTGESA